MEDDRLPEKIEAVRQLLSERMGGQKVDYILIPSATPTDIFFESAEGRPITDCGLAENSWMLSRLQCLPARLKAAGVPALFARTTDHQIVWKDTNSRPTLVDRDD